MVRLCQPPLVLATFLSKELHDPTVSVKLALLGHHQALMPRNANNSGCQGSCQPVAGNHERLLLTLSFSLSLEISFLLFSGQEFFY